MRAAKSLPLRLVSVACIVLVAVGLRAQAVPDRPGGARPVQLMKPRIPPLPETQWTDGHRKLVAMFSRDGRAGNDLRTLLHVPEMVEGLMPFNIYVSNDFT